MTSAAYAVTSEGAVQLDQLGVTLIHEHILFDLSFMFMEPEDPAGLEMAGQPIRLDNLHWIRIHPASNRDNARLTDQRDALNDLRLARQSGVGTVVDVSMRGEAFAFNPTAIRTIAREAGLTLITGTGYYIEESIPAAVKQLSTEEICDEMLRDLNEGYPEAGYCAGVVGEIGTSFPLGPTGEKVLRAAVRAQRQTGAALYLHPGYSEKAPLELANTAEEDGADPGKTIICHVDSRLRGDQAVYRELAGRGFYLGFDTFGREQYIDFIGRQHPSDSQRLQWIREVCDAAFVERVLISTDICWKSELVPYGGYGRSHIMKNTVPRMRREGFSEDIIHTILVRNPAAALSRPALVREAHR